MTEEPGRYTITVQRRGDRIVGHSFELHDPAADASRRRKALETLRRSLTSAAKQVQELIDIEEQTEHDTFPRSRRMD